MKIEDFYSEVQFRVYLFLLAGFRVLANFCPSLRVLVPTINGRLNRKFFRTFV